MDICPAFTEVADTEFGFPHSVDGNSVVKILAEGKDDQWRNETTSEVVADCMVVSAVA